MFTRANVVRIEAISDKLRFRTANAPIEIRLTPHDMRAPNYRGENTGTDGNTAVERPPVNTFIGQVNGETNSNVRINVVGGRFSGYFENRGERFFIEPAAVYSSSAGEREYVVYRVEDAIRTNGFSCGTKLADKFEYGRSMTKRDVAASPSVEPKRIELATEADFEYVNTLGGVSNANEEIMGILNGIEGLYVSDTALSITVTFQHSWTTPDPFAGANSELTVRNFQAYWNANHPQSAIPRDTAHLFTGKAHLLSQGWAFIGVICNNPNFAYGMSGYINWSPGRYLVTGHELAHNSEQIMSNRLRTAEIRL